MLDQKIQLCLVNDFNAQIGHGFGFQCSSDWIWLWISELISLDMGTFLEFPDCLSANNFSSTSLGAKQMCKMERLIIQPAWIAAECSQQCPLNT